MSRYQLRIHEDQVLKDVIQIMAAKTWGILLAWQVFRKEPEPKDFDDFRRSIYLDMVPFVKSYKLCGYSNICLDEAESTPWAPPAHVLSASPRDLVYQLFPGNGLDQFLDGLARAAMESILRLVKPELKEEIQSLMKTAFRTILGEYLFFNPLCGKTELCVYSFSAPQKVWGKERN
ncbi:hypothetical protein L0222_30155 [bacterium]|nr:hypothetical protein [bacterium]